MNEVDTYEELVASLATSNFLAVTVVTLRQLVYSYPNSYGAEIAKVYLKEEPENNRDPMYSTWIRSIQYAYSSELKTLNTCNMEPQKIAEIRLECLKIAERYNPNSSLIKCIEEAELLATFVISGNKR